MKYFIDTEFIEKPNTIELISIGIKCEDGREFYAISKDFNLKKAWKDDWIKENVLKLIFDELSDRENNQRKRLNFGMKFIKKFNYKNIKYLINIYGKTINDLSKAIKIFCGRSYASINREGGRLYKIDWQEITGEIGLLVGNGMGKTEHLNSITFDNPIFYGYYADYDWVVFCWIFGRMIDLPKGFPMYCRDLKQMMDEKDLSSEWKNKNCPDPKDEHSALADAKWNHKLFLNILRVCGE